MSKENGLTSRYAARNASSITVLPTKMKIMNFIAAYLLLSPPQTPIRKNIGIMTSSQKT
jgi:hypothetical protein